METYHPEYWKVSKKAELSFKDWLDKNKVPHIYIEEDKEIFSSMFKGSKGKRPDFMILIPYFGLIFVDVKYKKLTTKHKDFALDSMDAKKYSSLQREFNINVWYVISNEDYDYETWFWIPVSKVLEEKLPLYVSSKSKMDFIPIKLDKFIQISTGDSLGKLISDLVRGG